MKQEVLSVFLTRRDRQASIELEFSGEWTDDLRLILGTNVSRAVGEVLATQQVTVQAQPTKPVVSVFYNSATRDLTAEVTVYVTRGSRKRFAKAVGEAVMDAIRTTPGWPNQWVPPARTELLSVFRVDTEDGPGFGVQFAGTFTDARGDMKQILLGRVIRAVEDVFVASGRGIPQATPKPMATVWYDARTGAVLGIDVATFENDQDAALSRSVYEAILKAIRATPGWPHQWLKPTKSSSVTH